MKLEKYAPIKKLGIFADAPDSKKTKAPPR
jgi:hypothetical protein